MDSASGSYAGVCADLGSNPSNNDFSRQFCRYYAERTYINKRTIIETGADLENLQGLLEIRRPPPVGGPILPLLEAP